MLSTIVHFLCCLTILINCMSSPESVNDFHRYNKTRIMFRTRTIKETFARFVYFDMHFDGKEEKTLINSQHYKLVFCGKNFWNTVGVVAKKLKTSKAFHKKTSSWWYRQCLLA